MCKPSLQYYSTMLNLAGLVAAVTTQRHGKRTDAYVRIYIYIYIYTCIYIYMYIYIYIYIYVCRLKYRFPSDMMDHRSAAPLYWLCRQVVRGGWHSPGIPSGEGCTQDIWDTNISYKTLLFLCIYIYIYITIRSPEIQADMFAASTSKNPFFFVRTHCRRGSCYMSILAPSLHCLPVFCPSRSCQRWLHLGQEQAWFSLACNWLRTLAFRSCQETDCSSVHLSIGG